MSVFDFFTLQKGIQLAKQAADAEVDDNWEKAIVYYTHSVEYFLHALKCK